MNPQFKMPQLSLRGLEEAIRQLVGIIPSIKDPKKTKDGKSKKQKTKRGATHVVGSVFKSKRLSKLTPAQYRHQHAANPHKAAIKMMKGDKKHAKFSV